MKPCALIPDRHPRVRRALGALALVLTAPMALAQSRWREQAVPLTTLPQFVTLQTRHWYQPRSADFERSAAALGQAVQVQCAGVAVPADTSREAWRRALADWSRLSAVAVGPLVERRSARRVDFQPVRAELLDKAVAAAAQGALDMDRVGSAARGFAALEALLWAGPRLGAVPGRCALAQALSLDLQQEAQALRAGFAARATVAEDMDEALVVEQMGEAVNQWIGGVDQLRMQALERPLLEARTRGLRSPELPRALSGSSAADRASRWSALRALAVLDAPLAPPTGEAVVPLETLLRGRGLNALADRLLRQTQAVDQALQRARGDAPAALAVAVQALASLRSLVEADVAPALDIRIGFSDADGD